MVDKDKIRERLSSLLWFTTLESVDITDDGIVNMNCQEISLKIDTHELSVNFGTVTGNVRFSGKKYGGSGDGDLTTLKGCPTKIIGDFTCSCNEILQSLDGGPQHVSKDYYAYDCPLTSLSGLPQFVGNSFGVTYNSHLPVLRLPVIDYDFYLSDNTMIYELLQKFSEMDLSKKQKIWECQKKLIEMGFESNAKY
jgi:hypothetical protein